MSLISILVRGACLGMSAVIAITSLASATDSLRRGVSVEPYIWVEAPFGASTPASILWHSILASAFLAAGLSLLRHSSNHGIPSNPNSNSVRLPKLLVGVSVILVLIAILAANDIVSFYRLLLTDRIASDFPIPLSLVLVGLPVAMVHFIRSRSRQTQLAIWQQFVALFLGCCIGSSGLVFLHLVTFGTTDYTRAADVAVILGAKVYPDGTPSLSLADRLRTGIELYKTGRVRYLLMTGGTGVEGYNEAWAMREFAVTCGVPRDQILVDAWGMNTLASARNCKTIFVEHDLSNALIVSHYYHLARCKMLFVEQGIHCTTVPARMSMRLVKEPYYVLRECVAYLTYSLSRPFRIGSMTSA